MMKILIYYAFENKIMLNINEKKALIEVSHFRSN